MAAVGVPTPVFHGRWYCSNTSLTSAMRLAAALLPCACLQRAHGPGSLQQTELWRAAIVLSAQPSYFQCSNGLLSWESSGLASTAAAAVACSCYGVRCSNQQQPAAAKLRHCSNRRGQGSAQRSNWEGGRRLGGQAKVQAGRGCRVGCGWGSERALLCVLTLTSDM